MNGPSIPTVAAQALVEVLVVLLAAALLVLLLLLGVRRQQAGGECVLPGQVAVGPARHDDALAVPSLQLTSSSGDLVHEFCVYVDSDGAPG